jgi:SAM-dependent methyltransferase
MLKYVRDVVASLEADPVVATRAAAFAGLRRLGIDDFGEFLLSMPNLTFPKLSRLLPAMASDEVQRNWTGNCGIDLLKQTTSFVRAVSYSFARLSGRSLDQASVLDFGCGYGRIARLFYYFTDEDRFCGVDPWDRSIELCRESGLVKNFHVSDYLPDTLPVSDRRFDLIYAFSVFTHLSELATTKALNTLRKYIAEDGMLTITIRPVEYWQQDTHALESQKAALSARHRATGFAFLPHQRAPVDGDVTYGDTSLTLDWLEKNFPRWAVRGTDRSLYDPYQRYVYLTPT